MALDSGQVRLAPYGHVYVAPVGTVLPTDVTTPFGAGWKELGYLDEEGVGITPTTDVEEFFAWQSAVSVKQSITQIGLELKFNMIQVNQATTALFFFGSAWTVAAGVATLSILSNVNVDERALAVEWTDDAGKVNRLLLGRGMVTDRDDMMINRKEMVAQGVTFKALEAAGYLARILSNDPNLLSS